MRIVVIGATGFIGRQVTAWLPAKRFEAHAAVRSVASIVRRLPGVTVHAVDLARRPDPSEWGPVLADADAIVDCVGALERDAAAVRVDGTLALFECARAAGVKRTVHISGISIGAAVATDYAISLAVRRKPIQPPGESPCGSQ